MLNIIKHIKNFLRIDHKSMGCNIGSQIKLVKTKVDPCPRCKSGDIKWNENQVNGTCNFCGQSFIIADHDFNHTQI